MSLVAVSLKPPMQFITLSLLILLHGIDRLSKPGSVDTSVWSVTRTGRWQRVSGSVVINLLPF